MKRVLRLAAVTAFALLSVCSTPTPPPPPVDVPAHWRMPADEATTLADRPWGELFRTPELDALVR